MSSPLIERDGDIWALTWPEHDVGFSFERLRESSDGLHAELTVEGIGQEARGRLLGPVKLNLLSAQTQTSTSKALADRAKELPWTALVAQACAIVAKQYRAPSPTIDLSQLDGVGEVEYLVPRLLPLGETTLMYGDGESCKSLLAQRIALSCTAGVPLPWGEHATQQVRTLYLDWETNARTVVSRLRRLAAGCDLLDLPQIHYRGAMRSGQVLHSLEDELQNLRAEISRLDIGLVVVDSIGFACSGPLTEDQTARSALNCLRQLAPATRLVVAHVSNETAKQSSGKARPFGSAFFWNGQRSGIEVRRSEDGPADLVELGIFHRKANDGEHHPDIGLRVSFDGLVGPIRFDRSDIRDTPDLLARTSVSQRIRAALRDGAKDTRQLAEEVSTSESSVRTTLGRMNDVVNLAPGRKGQAAVWGLSQ